MKDEGADAGFSTAGSLPNLLCFLLRASNENCGSWVSTGWHVKKGQAPAQGFAELFFEQRCPDNDVQDIGTHGSTLDAGLLADRGGFLARTADQEYGAGWHVVFIAHAMKI